MNYKKKEVMWNATAHYFIPMACPNGRWHADLVAHRKIIQQLRKEAGLTDKWPDPQDAYDRILAAAGKHNLGLQRIYTE